MLLLLTGLACISPVVVDLLSACYSGSAVGEFGFVWLGEGLSLYDRLHASVPFHKSVVDDKTSISLGSILDGDCCMEMVLVSLNNMMQFFAGLLFPGGLPWNVGLLVFFGFYNFGFTGQP
ncbi:hypothetical protein NC651_032847 [Populus alba x Populus x berolinensis]|nr:hypothetical protein NC651_032847 [Populus alba x Populus x berolinensis]